MHEIEYLSALHQTCVNPIRSDGTISSEDVRIYLRSRYGLDIPAEEAADIVRGLAGTVKPSDDDSDENANYPTPEFDKKTIAALAQSNGISTVSDNKTNLMDDNEYLDLVQFTAILLMPTLQRAKRQVDIAKGIVKIEPIPDLPNTNWRLAFTHPKLYRYNCKLAKQLMRQKKDREFHNSLEPSDADDNIVFMVLRVLFAGIDVVDVDSDGGRYVEGSLPHVVINERTVTNLLDSFGFSDLATDDLLVSQMVQAAGGPGTVFDELAFARALTADLDLRQVGIEDSVSETFEDVYGYDLNSLEYIDGSRINRQKQKKDEALAALQEEHSNTDGFDEEKGRDTPAGTTPPSPAPSSGNRASSKNESSSAGAEDRKWVSFEDDSNIVDWSKAPTEVRVSSAGEIEVSPPRQEQPQACIEVKKPTHTPTAPYIDYVVDEYKSIAYLCVIWVFYLFGATAFMSMLGLVDLQIIRCTDGFLCELVQQIWTWLVFGLILTLGGIIVVAPLR